MTDISMWWTDEQVEGELPEGLNPSIHCTPGPDPTGDHATHGLLNPMSSFVEKKLDTETPVG